MFSTCLTDIIPVDAAKDFVNLGRRLFLFDGVNPNIVSDGYTADDRIAGAFPQLGTLTVSLAAGSGLSPGTTYNYAVRRRVTVGPLETVSAATLSEDLAIDPYKLLCGASSTLLTSWQGLTDGSYKITINGTAYSIVSVTTAGAADLEDVAAMLETSLQSAVSNKDYNLKVVYSSGSFVFSASVPLTVLSAVGAGTDISGSSWLNGLSGSLSSPSSCRAALNLEQYEYLSESADSRVKVYYQIYRNTNINSTVLHLVDEISQDEISGTSSKGTWTSGTAYSSGDSVILSGTMYRCFADHTAAAATQPASGASWTTYWRELLISPSVSAWTSGTAYAANAFCKAGTILYTCRTAHTAASTNQPGSGAEWRDYWTKKASYSFIDSCPDDALNEDYSVNLSATETNLYIPPCNFARICKGRIVAGGSIPFSPEDATADVSSGALDLVIISGTPVKPVDTGAYIMLADNPYTFQIKSIDPVRNAYILTNSLSAAVSGKSFTVFRDNDVIYLGNPLPGNIEAYSEGTTIYSNFDNAEIRGIASHSGSTYILRSGGIEILDISEDGQGVLSPLAGSPPPCVAHKSISDDTSKSPYLFYYAGSAGVVAVSGSSFKILSADISDIIKNDVDHSNDRYAHGCYSPVENVYRLWLFRKGDVETYGLRVPQLMLVFNLNSNTWTSGELAASASGLWQDEDGTDMLVIGVAGGVAKLDNSSCDGADIQGTVTSADSSSITDSSANFPDTLAGLPVHVHDADGNFLCRSIIYSSSSTSLTVFSDLPTIPAGSRYHVGAIRFAVETGDWTTAESFELRRKSDRLVVAGNTDVFPEWTSGTAYSVGDKVQISDDQLGDKAYKCTAAHTAAESNRPGIGTVWRDNPVNVSVSIKGTGLERNRMAIKSGDLKKGKIEISGADSGLRSRGMSVRIEGDGTENLSVIGISLSANPINKDK